MTSETEGFSTQQRILDIYLEALEKIYPNEDFTYIHNTDEQIQVLRRALVQVQTGVRQTSHARIARAALKAASYERINGSSS